MTAVDSCLWCYGTGYVHTSGGVLGDLIVGPAVCFHDGRWRTLDAAERAGAEHVAALHRLHTRATLASITSIATQSADTRDFTEPRRPQDDR